MIYFEDLEVGAETEFGSYEVTREEVLEFARKYDPQPFHLSDEEAEKITTVQQAIDYVKAHSKA